MYLVIVLITLHVLFFLLVVLDSFGLIISNDSLHLKNIKFDEPLNALVVSDLHLENKANYKLFIRAVRRILKSKKINTIIINGDLFNKRVVLEDSRSLAKKVINALHHLEILSNDSNVSNIFYVMSLSSHDPIVNMKELEIKTLTSSIFIIRGMLHFSTPNNTFVFLHGDTLIKNGIIALFVAILGRLFGVHLLVETFGKKALGIKQDAWFISSHTHFPGIDSSNKVINTGAWKKITRFLDPKTFILILDDVPRLYKVVSKTQ